MEQGVWSLSTQTFTSVSSELVVQFPKAHRNQDPAAYPYFEIYPACTVEEDISQPVPVMLSGSNNLLTCYPSVVICKSVPFDNLVNTDELLDPAVYPHLDIYPPVSEGVKTKESVQVDTTVISLSGVSALYPNFVICEPSYMSRRYIF